MKKIIRSLLILFVVFGINFKLPAQQFNTGELSVVKTSQVITENYTAINLSKEIIDDVNANRFDLSNVYTYLQIVNDLSGNKYHILYQTNFNGKILYLSYSNNLSAIFTKREKPMFLFIRCLKNINNHISSVQVMNDAIGCIIDRLNYSFEN